VSTPEYVIWLVTHNLKVLRHDGLPEEVALRKIDGLLRLSADPSHEPSWRLQPYLKRWLGLWWPDYAEFGDNLLKGAIRRHAPTSGSRAIPAAGRRRIGVADPGRGAQSRAPCVAAEIEV
jgi:hypothetical protein